MLLVETSWSLAIAAFVLFRIFDIGKPPGVRYFDRNYLEGWGVMMDDVVAGIYVNVVLGVYLLWIQPHFFPL
jgi:phosphatidylglycerophosphatase A